MNMSPIEFLERKRAEEYLKRHCDGAGNAPEDFDRVPVPWFYRTYRNLPFCAECLIWEAQQRDGEESAC